MERTTGRTRAYLRALLAASLGLGWLAVAPPPAEPATASENRMAGEIVAQINNERAARGLSRLGVSGTLAAQAQQIAEDNRNRSCHSCHSGMGGAGEVVQWSGGAGTSGRSTVAWMNSTIHRDILMSPGLTAIGVGVGCYADGGQEAVGRVLGPTTTGAPATPVVTSRSDGSRCGASPTSTSTTRATTTTTTAPQNGGGANHDGNDSRSTADGSAAPAAVDAPPPPPSGGGSANPAASGLATSPMARARTRPAATVRAAPAATAQPDTAEDQAAAEQVPENSTSECSREASWFQSFGRRCVLDDGAFESAFSFPASTSTSVPPTTAAPRNLQASRSPLEDETTGLSGLDNPRAQGAVIAVGAVAALGLVSFWRFRAGRW